MCSLCQRYTHSPESLAYLLCLSGVYICVCMCLLTEWGSVERDSPQSGAGNRLESEPLCPDSLISSLIHGLTAGSTRAHTHTHTQTHPHKASSKVQKETKEFVQTHWCWHKLQQESTLRGGSMIQFPHFSCFLSWKWFITLQTSSVVPPHHPLNTSIDVMLKVAVI